MQHVPSRRLAALVVAIASVTFASLAQSQVAPGATVEGDTIMLGQTAAQSGPQAPIGASKWGLEAFIGWANAKGGVAGKKLGLVSYDDGYQPAQTTALDKKLVYEDRVFAIVGSIGSPTTAAVYKTLNEAHVPLISMGSGSPIFYEPGLKYVFPGAVNGESRGFATAWAAKPLVDKLAAPSNDVPPVWPSAYGDTRGLALEPLHPSVVEAASEDPLLREQLTLIDAIRIGDARIRGLAADLLVERLSRVPT